MESFRNGEQGSSVTWNELGKATKLESTGYTVPQLQPGSPAVSKFGKETGEMPMSQEVSEKTKPTSPYENEPVKKRMRNTLSSEKDTSEAGAGIGVEENPKEGGEQNNKETRALTVKEVEMQDAETIQGTETKGMSSEPQRTDGIKDIEMKDAEAMQNEIKNEEKMIKENSEASNRKEADNEKQEKREKKIKENSEASNRKETENEKQEKRDKTTEALENEVENEKISQQEGSKLMNPDASKEGNGKSEPESGGIAKKKNGNEKDLLNVASMVKELHENNPELKLHVEVKVEKEEGEASERSAASNELEAPNNKPSSTPSR